MKILVIGNDINLLECRQKFGDKHIYEFIENQRRATLQLAWADVIFDFLSADAHLYTSFEGAVFIDTSRITLSAFKAQVDSKARFIGFSGLPTFLNREVLEVSLLNDHDYQELKRVCDLLNTRFAIVTDQVGMVTPRIICMIINEAYFTLEEGTATRGDIDLAMKLGTNYPYGPFEWGERIGLKKVCGLLDAVYSASGDERYQTCPLLKQEAKI